jgi:methylglutaconyl-CoA hydratase
MSDPILQVEPVRPGVEALTLNRPERRNALTIALMKEICETIGRLSADPSRRVLLLRGAGPAFCSGLDLREASDISTAEEGPEWVARMFSSVRTTPLVTICEAQGAAMAGGAGLLAACDFTVAADDLRIGFPEVRRGLVPALVSTILRHKLRDADLRELFLLAEPIDARRALSMGLVHRVVPPGQVRSEALRLADLVLQGAPRAVRDTKRLISDLKTSSELDATRIAHQYHRDARVGQEAREGLAAFLEKRPPLWVDGGSRP